MIRKFFIVLLVLLLMGIPGVVSAAGELGTADMKEGTTVKASTEIIMDKGAVSFTDKSTGLSAITTTEIDGVEFIPAKTTESKDLEWSTGEFDPIVKMVYSYDGKTLKETITLKEDKVLTFPITLSTYSKLIPWDHGQWKIVRSNSFETMKGIVLEKPYGIDANGKRIEMEYKYDKGVLTLVYDRTITEWVEEDKIVIDNKTGTEITERVLVQKQSQIAYPLVIDPTWVAIDGHWIDNTTSSTHIVEMWNATGTTSWTPPAGVTSVEYLVLAGGGGSGMGGIVGAGGGAGALLNATGYAVNGSIAVVVGAGGAGGVTNGPTNIPAVETNRGRNGSNSSFSAISATGGGGGGSGGAAYINGVGGGSGGGATISGTVGSGTTGGNNGGAGFTGTAYGCGGGGGAGSAGVGGTSSAGGNGGTGVSSSITGTAVVYATGGGGAAVGAYTQGVGGSTNINHNSAVSGSAGESATANSGSGGGSSYGAGPYPNGGAGGSGIVIIKYLRVAPTASFVITLTDTSTGTSLSWQWNVTNLLGNNTEVTFSTSRHTNMILGQGNWLVKLTATNSLGSSSATKYIGLNLSSSLVYFWNRTG